MTWYPRRAVYGNGCDKWEIDILTGNAWSRGLNSVENEVTFTYKDGINFYNKIREKNGKKPKTDMTRSQGYELARTLALREFDKRQKNDPVVGTV